MFLPFILTLLVWISAAEVNAAEESVISVNDGNWIEYFNEDGTIKDSYPDGVVFALEGEFHNREFIINKPASLITADTQGILTDCSVSIRSANVTVNGLYISLSGEEAGRNVIEIIDADNVTISNNTISIDKEDAKKNGYPINASNTNNLKISNNTIIYDAIIQSGNENDYNIDRGLMITGTADTYLTGIEVTDNIFNLNLPFRSINWENAITPSAGVELSYCKGAVFNSNKVTVTSIGNVGYSPVLDAVLVTNCIDGAENTPAVTMKENEIHVSSYTGHPESKAEYVYAVYVDNSNTILSETKTSTLDYQNNDIQVITNGYGYGIQLTGPITKTSISDSKLQIQAVTEGLGIYATNWNGELSSADISNNTIDLEAPVAIGILHAFNGGQITKNTISAKKECFEDLEGQLLAGIIHAAYANVNGAIEISENTINTEGTNNFVDDNVPYDFSHLPEKTSTGIYTENPGAVVKNNLIRTTGYGITISKNAATVTGNDVTTTADYAVNVTDTASEVTDNILMAKSADGDDAVYAENQAAIVRDNLAKSTMIAKQPENLKLEYGYASGPVLSVEIKPNLYSEVTYQWFQCSDSSGTDPQQITNATEADFAVPQGLKAGKSYYYCRLTGKNAGEDPAVEDTNIIKVRVLAKTVSNPVIELTENEFVYDKTAKKPAVTVRDGNTLIPTEEYTVSYSSNINAGKEAVISITDQEGGNYVVNGNQTFTILPKEVGLVWTDTSLTYDGKPHVPAATVTGIIEGDTCTVKVTGEQTESSATPYTATAVSLSNLNYALPTKNTVSFMILKAKESSPTGNTEASDKNAAIQKAETADKQSVKNLEQTIFAQKNDKELKNSSFSVLKAKAGSVKKNAITVSWIKNKNAEGYLIYGNLAGKKKAMVKLGQTGKTRFTVKKILSKKLGKGTGYKFTVVSYNTSGGYRKVLSVSKTVFSCTLGGKNTNVKKITLKAKSASVKKGKKYRIIVKTVKADKKMKLKTFRKLNFESSNKKIATVSAKGVVKGIRKGKVTIYVYAQNGIYATVKIKVK